MTMRSHAVRLVTVTGVFIVVIVCAIFAFRHAGRWLIHEDPLSHADVILVLSGGMPYRAEEAAKVYREGYAPEIWLTHPVSPAAELRNLGVHYESDEDYNAEVLTRLGVPSSAIHVLPNEIVDTEQELEEAVRQMKKEGKSTINHCHFPRTYAACGNALAQALRRQTQNDRSWRFRGPI
jgi:uncharacterized SAM-binding protein YcdF (DUF218 family)